MEVLKMLNQEQKKALDIMLSGGNVFLSGGAGTGKSYLIRSFLKAVTNKIIEFADILRASKMFSPAQAKILPFRHPVEIAWEPVSADTGNYLQDSVRETYDVGHLAPDQTDFGVRISDDSMEPLYHTGDVAWIQKKDSIANGEIGIFCLNGNTYIKELHDEPDGVFLVSLNEKYQPIQVLESDSFKIFGKVIGKCKGAEIPGFH